MSPGPRHSASQRKRRVWTVSTIAPPPSTTTTSTHRGTGPGPRPVPSKRRRGPRLFRLRDWRVRTKLGAVLTIPAIAFLAVAGVQTNTSVRQAESLQHFTRQVRLARQVTEVVHQVQAERDHSAGVVAAIAAGTDRHAGDPRLVRSALAADDAASDRAGDALRTAARPLLADPGVRSVYDGANRALQALVPLRAGVIGGWLGRDAIFDAYTGVIRNLLGLLPAESQVGSGGESLSRVIRSLNTLALSK